MPTKMAKTAPGRLTEQQKARIRRAKTDHPDLDADQIIRRLRLKDVHRPSVVATIANLPRG